MKKRKLVTGSFIGAMTIAMTVAISGIAFACPGAEAGMQRFVQTGEAEPLM